MTKHNFYLKIENDINFLLSDLYKNTTTLFLFLGDSMKKLLYGITDIPLKFVNCEDRIKLYKKVGYDFVALEWKKDFDENIDFINFAKRYKLGIDDIHLSYEKINDLWLENEFEFFNYLKKCIDTISSIDNIDKDVILHITKSVTPPEFNQTGFQNISHLIEYGKQRGVNVLLENLRRPDFLEKFISLYDKDFGLCFDVGHANLYMEDYFEFLEKYSNMITTTHIHDNKKDRDAHLGLYLGSIDWEKTIDALLKSKTNNYHLEIFPSTNDLTYKEFEEFLTQNLNHIKNLTNQN